MMNTHWHSVMLEKAQCKGCTNCLKHCPTQAIRVQNGKAKILKERCIDCGECIRVCPYHAKKAVTDSFDILSGYKYKVALVAPAFCAQFSKTENINLMLTSLKKIGFNEIFEVARGAQKASEETRKLLASGELLKPTISSACPAVMRLIAIRFPNLINNIIPLRSPMELSAIQARKEAVEKTGLAPEDIGIIFISPCAAKATEIRNSINTPNSYVDGVLSIKDTYLKMAQNIGRIHEDEIEDITCAGGDGILWAIAGGEAGATHAERHIAVDGIQNVIQVFEDIEDGKLDDIEYVEALACTGGCVGGPLTAENSFVAESRLKRICQTLEPELLSLGDDIPSHWDKPLIYRPIMNLDEDIHIAMKKMMQLEEIYNSLPKLDCGSCGSPSCRSLAEDIVRGYAQETDCIFKLRERISKLVDEMVLLEKSYIPSREQDDNKDKK